MSERFTHLKIALKILIKSVAIFEDSKR